MKIAVHAQVLTEKNLNGIGYYTLNLLRALAAIDNENEYHLFSNRPLAQKVELKSSIVKPPYFLSYLGFSPAFKKTQCDLAFIPKEVAPPFLNKPIVMTAYDLYNFTQPKNATWQARLSAILAVKRHLKKAERILAISHDTKRAIVEHCDIDPAKVVVTHLGYDTELFHPYSREEIKEIKKKYHLTRPYFINPSSVWSPRKNLERIIAAFGNLPSDYQLAITGTKSGQLGERIVLLGYVPRRDLALLYAGAEALVFPSLYEGFGLPIIEAMACGCPVITSHSSALAEIAADAALLIDPYDTHALEQAMRHIADQQMLLKLKGLERAKAFSWRKTAQQTLSVFKTLNIN